MPELKNPRYELFCQEYMIDMNGSGAAIRAGYSPKASKEQAAHLLTLTNVRARVDELKAERSKAAAVSAEWVLTKLKEVHERCLEPQPVMYWDRDLNQMMQKIDEETGRPLFQFDSQGANKALELIGKHVGLFEKDNLQRANVINVFIEEDEEEEQRRKQNTIDVNADVIGSRTNNSKDTETGVPALLPSSDPE